MYHIQDLLFATWALDTAAGIVVRVLAAGLFLPGRATLSYPPGNMPPHQHAMDLLITACAGFLLQDTNHLMLLLLLSCTLLLLLSSLVVVATAAPRSQRLSEPSVRMKLSSSDLDTKSLIIVVSQQ